MENPPTLQVVVDQAKLTNESRRRFGKSGLAASGVILTLASRSALGGAICQSPSGFQSGNLSHHGQPAVCLGKPPSYWANCDQWPVNKNTQFGHIFSCPGSDHATIKLHDMVSGGHCDHTGGLCMLLTAAHLNEICGWTPFLTQETIQSMHDEWQAKGYFEPTATVKWYAPDICNYLNGTQ